ncbi:MAG: alpha/beta fold hydrolase [Gammaproteobacteria bacterium]|nr:alpha/beta fold hydrolase [Gammaproteobacteria bacterium]
MKAAIRGTEIYFDVAGMEFPPAQKPRPIMFMLHGGPGSDHTRYKYHSLELQEVAQLIFIDHRGSGRSKQTDPAEYTLENNIEDIEALRKYLGIEQIILLGTSYGGMVAQGYTIRYPKNVLKLILIATAPSHEFISEAKEYLLSNGTREQIAISEYLWNGTFRNEEHVAEFFKVMENLYTKNPGALEIPKNDISYSYTSLNLGFSRFLREFDFREQLYKVACPTLVLSGEEDWVCRPTQSRVIAEKIKSATLKIFENCGHSLAIDAHDEYIAITKKFIGNP